MSDDMGFSKELIILGKRIKDLEAIMSSTKKLSSSEDPESLSLILKRINAIQTLVDQIEVEIDKLEMRLSAIEHMGFRLRTGAQ
ncbi:MAG: hypothetical protein ACFFE2_03030 [Candidatus Thorarchaeota archaeon]